MPLFDERLFLWPARSGFSHHRARVIEEAGLGDIPSWILADRQISEGKRPVPGGPLDLPTDLATWGGSSP
jgi:hypothetical protein